MTYTREQLQSLFQAPFDDAAWTEFLHVFFGAGKLYAIPDLLEKKDDAAGFLLGEFETADSYRVGLFRFDITRGSILRRKSGLRALADRFLRGHGFDAAIAVFVQDGSAEWRFSYICDIKGAETAPRRFTYVFGDKAQNYRTPVERFAKLQSAGISQSNLDEAFSVEALSKQFYSELQDWYFWALTKVVWPDDLPELKNKETRNATPTIRLITRLIFVWFLKQKGIVPAKLFDEKTVKDWLNNTDATGSTYYKAILQNLFFATLNLDPEESPREFQKYGQKGVTAYRYKRFFKKDAAQQFCETCHEIPFLNGGLFENLDKNTETDIPLRVDCFSNLTENEPRLAVPDELFFGKEQTVDLSVFFDSDRKKSSVKTHGLFHILNAYNFTVEENTPFDKAVALDPELLGQIFENLLASFNPETRNTARKETGSFYTPREIVQYMVDESLIAYLKTRVENAPEEEIRNLTSYAGVENRLTDAQRKEIAEALFNAKIFDPACGSGAFPMGMLQQMVHILAQVDPKNAQLKTLAIKKAMEDCESSLGTHTDGGESMEQKLAAVGRVFDETREHPDYVRKLHLIENCLYGSDIQPIAVQITKLRFFISLVCEQDNKQADNEQADNAILPLPNLETNFVAANTLVGIHKPKNWADEDDDKTRELKEELRRIRHAHFSARRTAQKKSLRKDDENTRKQLQAHLLTLAPLPDKHRLETYQDQLVKAEQERKAVSAEKWEEVAGTAEEKDMFGNITRPAGLPLRVDVNQPKREKLDAQIRALEQGIQAELSKSANIAFAEEAEKLAHWDPYDQNAASAFFDTEWMFGIKEGFDIVMGNPPYIQLQNNGGELANVYKNADFKTFERTGDIYTLFYERGFQLLRDKAHLCFITSNKWMRAGYGESLRKFLAKSTLPKVLIDFAGQKIFESATVDTNILLFQKRPAGGAIEADSETCATNAVIGTANCRENLSLFVRQRAAPMRFPADGSSWVILNPIEQSIKAKIEKVGVPLKEWDIKIYRGILTGFNDAFIVSEEKRAEILANCKTADERKRTAELIRPILRGRDIKRYSYNWAGLYLIATHNGIPEKGVPRVDIKNYPAVKKHLDCYWEQIKARADQGDTPYNLRSCAYMDDFSKPKIVWGEISDKTKFALDARGEFCAEATTFLMTGVNLSYLVCYLNSSLSEYLFSKIGTTTGVGTVRWKKFKIEQLFVPIVENFIESDWRDLLWRLSKGDITETDINRCIYALCGLSPEEISLIENYSSSI